MRVRWTTDAASDLEWIAERIAKDRPDAAFRTARTIYQGLAALRDFPNRAGELDESREPGNSCFPPCLTLRLCRIKSEAIEVLRIYHAAQDWP